MGESRKVVDGKLEITQMGNVVIETLDRDEIIGKRAEAQTKVDHLQLDLDEAQAVVDRYNVYVAEIDG